MFVFYVDSEVMKALKIYIYRISKEGQYCILDILYKAFLSFRGFNFDSKSCFMETYQGPWFLLSNQEGRVYYP